MYWSRVIALDSYQLDSKKNWSIGPDLADQFDQLFDIEAEDCPEWKPEWDMESFANNHHDLKIANWKLS